MTEATIKYAMSLGHSFEECLSDLLETFKKRVTKEFEEEFRLSKYNEKTM